MTTRIQLLQPHEIKSLYDFPIFSAEDQEIFFEITEEISILLASNNTIKTKIYFLLQFGYFKATKQFYNFTFDDAFNDAQYLIKTYYKTSADPILESKISKNKLYEQRKYILLFFNYSPWNKASMEKANKQLEKLIKIHPGNKERLRELFSYLNSNCIVIPHYRIFQDLFTNAISTERNRLTKVMSKLLASNHKKQLDNFLESEGSLSHLSVLKADQKNFKLRSLRKEVIKLKELKNLYILSSSLVPQLNISQHCINHYCDLVVQYTAFRLKKFNKHYARMFLLCYIHSRYQQISDFLIITFQYHIKNTREKATEYADIKEKEYNTNSSQHMPKVANFLRWFVNDSINKSLTYDVFSTKAFQILPESQFCTMADLLDKIGFDRERARWHYISHANRKIALYLRSIFMVLDFSHQKSTSERLTAIQLLQTSLNANKTASQIDVTLIMETIVSKKKRQYMYAEHDTHLQIDFAKLEFFVYEKIIRNIEEGIIFCSNSLSYKSLDDDFISNINEDKKLKLIEELGYTRVLTFSNTRLEELCADLHSAWIRTNNNIKDGNNSSLKFNTPKNQSKWSLSRSHNEDIDNTSVFDQLGQTEIASIAYYVFKKFNLIKIFSHIKPYRSKQGFSPDNIIACTLAAAFGCSLNKMSEISDLDLHEFKQTYTNAIRLETLKNANDSIVNKIAKLEIFTMWNIIPNKRLSDADGQKFESKLETIQSRHSSKFFGLGKGIVSYTLVTNHIPINSRIISPNEHESHFTFDVIYNNTSEIQPDMVTGDMHSINQLNFFILDAINVEFVPSYRDIYDKSKKLYCVGNQNKYEGLIKPVGQINIELIKEQSKTIEKMLLSLILQETKQSIIVKKLSSHKRYGRLKKALWEYNKILSSTHILNLIDNKELRKNIKIARNRTESFHQLQSKIRKVHGGKFNGRTMLENEIWNQAARLVANMVVAYNSMILNDLAKEFPELIYIIRKISPIAWQHINFSGKYTFKNKTKLPSFDEIVEKLKKWL